MTKHIITFIFLCTMTSGFAQFVKDPIVSNAIRDVIQGNTAWGDYDNDGDMDLALCGVDGGLYAGIYRNDNGTFVDINAGLPGLDMSTVSWGDIDNDGDLDLLLAGMDSKGTAFSMIYRNNQWVFADINAGLTGFHTVSSQWGDYDNDGDLDIALIGKINGDGTRDYLNIYRNDNGTFNEVAVPVQPTGYNMQGSVSWGDYDNDDDLDLLVTGLGPNAAGDDLVTTIVRNDAGSFVASGIVLPGIANSCAKWGDFDQDGDPDIAMEGVTFTGEYFTALLRNDGAGTFVNINAPLNNVAQGSLDWGDFDNDGDVDLLVIGLDGVTFEPATNLYRNDGGALTAMTDVLQGIWGVGTWGDYDGDHDLDIMLAGVDKDYNFITDVYENTYKLYQRIAFDGLTDKVYGDADLVLAAVASSGLPVAYEVVSGPAVISDNTLSITGAGDVVVKASQAGDSDYKPAMDVQQAFTIGKATITAIADDQMMAYGEPIPDLTVSYSGFVNGENATVLSEAPGIGTAAVAGSDAGTYAITLSGGKADNYNINLTNGVLTIDKAVATIVVSNLEHIFDGTPKEAAIAIDPENLNYTVTYNGGDTPPTQVGTYDLEVSIDDINYQGQASEIFSIILISGQQENYADIDILIYPVPADQELKFAGDLKNIGHVLIYDLMGKVILNKTIPSQRLDVSHISPGTYVLNLVDHRGIKKFTKTIIIR